MTSTVNYICNNENGNEVPFLSFTYDDNGIRTSKTFEGVTTYYITANGNIMAQYQYDEEGNVVHFMEFLYDNNADRIGFTYNENPYFYIKNVQGEITNIVDENGADIASYRYSPHGESNYYCDETALQYGYTQTELEEIATANPIRYKGYYLDEELPFYYLQSRYYVPTWGRFLNADIPLYAQSQKDEFAGINLFAYCRNNPVNFSDPTGFKPKKEPELGDQVVSIIFSIIEIGGLIQQIEIDCKPLYDLIEKWVEESPEKMAKIFLGIASMINVAWSNLIDDAKDAAIDYTRSIYDAAEGSSLGIIGGILNLIIDAFDKSDDDFYTDDQKSMFIFLDAIAVILPEIIEGNIISGVVFGVIFTVIYNITQAIFNYHNHDIFHV